MGIIISRFRKKKTTSEQLEDIEQKIKSIEKFQKETEQQFRRVIGKLVLSSILVYLVALVVYYYYFSPNTFRENIFKFMPLLVFPIAIYLSRRIISWYYKRKLSKNEITLKNLKVDKKKILDEVMDKETYKIAKEILEKYAPEQLSKDLKPTIAPIKAILPPTPRSDTTTRHRIVTPAVTKRFNGTPLPDIAYQAVPNSSNQLQPKLPLARPILPKNRGAFDKLVDLVVGDGPNQRYALICRMCSSHNGMALKSEFEYLAFRCAYCLQWNPARKQKPHAPNLAPDSGSLDDSDANNSEFDRTENDAKSKDDCDASAVTPTELESENETAKDADLCTENATNSVPEVSSTEKKPDLISSYDMADLKNVIEELTDEEKNSQAKDTADSSNSNIISNADTDQR